MREAAERAYQLEPAGSPWRPLACLLSGIALHLGGDREAARRELEEGADHAAGAAPSVTSLCLAECAVIALEEKDWDTAAELSDSAGRCWPKPRDLPEGRLRP